MKKKKFFELVGLVFKNQGLLDMSGLQKLLDTNLRAKNFDDLKKPLFVAATNFATGKAEYFSKGNLTQKLLASSSIPVLFNPQKIDGKTYVDGGLVNNLPLKPIHKKCKKIIGVNVNPLEQNTNLEGIPNIAIRSFHISIANSVYHKKELFDIFIEPTALKNYGYFNAKQSRDLFTIGYKSARKVLN